MSETLRPLVEAAQRGDRQALNALAGCVDRFVRIFSGSLSRGVRQAYGSTIDFVLEGLAEAMASLGSFEYRSDEEFYAWASRFIRNRIISVGRDAARKKRAGRPASLDAQGEPPASDDPTASQALSRGEVRDCVGNALLEAQLAHPEEMEIVLLKVFEGHSWPEIREMLGLSSDKRARTLFARGVDLLRPRVEARLGHAGLEELLGP